MSKLTLKLLFLALVVYLKPDSVVRANEFSAEAPGGRHFKIAANDGILLDAYYTTPAGERPEAGWPCIVTLHGYSRGLNENLANQSAKDGYLGVVYSSRGNKKSEGYNTFGWREIFDVRDVISHLIDNLPVNSARIGVTGSSFGGFRSYFAAVIDKRIRTICPSAFPTYGPHAFLPNNVLPSFIFYTTASRTEVRALGLFPQMAAHTLRYQFDEARTLADLTSVQWFAGDIECPVFIRVGLMDVVNPANKTIAFFNQLRVPKKLYLGSGGHGARPDREDAARAQEVRRRWLEYWLKDIDNGIMQEPDVFYGLRPQWKPATAPTFPGLATRPLVLYPTAGGQLAETPRSERTSVRIENRWLRKDVIWERAASLQPAATRGVVSESSWNFETDELPNPVTLLGAPAARLEIQTNAPIWQVYAALYDVAPEGEAELVTMMPYGDDQPIDQASIVEFELRTMPYRFESGHRIRLELRNHGEPTFVPYYQDFECQVFLGGKNPSQIELPIR